MMMSGSSCAGSPSDDEAAAAAEAPVFPPVPGESSRQQVCQSPAGVGNLTLRPVLYRVMVVVVGCLVVAGVLGATFFIPNASVVHCSPFFLGNKKELLSFPAKKKKKKKKKKSTLR
jgi:hypothetical protein